MHGGLATYLQAAFMGSWVVVVATAAWQMEQSADFYFGREKNGPGFPCPLLVLCVISTEEGAESL